MPDELSPEARAQLRGIVKKLSVSHDIDPEIQEELYGHVEDKTLAYLSGEESVSEADALLLTREHFGDPRSVREFLSVVHAPKATTGTMRRIAAITILSLAVMVTAKLLYLLVACALPVGILSAAGRLAWSSASILYVLVMLGLLRRWNRMAKAGSVWFERWRPLALTGLVLGLAAALFLIPIVGVSYDVSLPPWVHRTASVLAHSAAMLWVVLWVWWADRKPRRIRAMVQGAGASFLFLIATNAVMRMPFSTVGLSPDETFWKLAYGNLPDSMVAFAYDFGVLGLSLIGRVALGLLLYAAFAGLVALARRKFRPATVA